MKTQISYSTTVVGSSDYWGGVPYYVYLNAEQKEELKKTSMVTITENDRILSISAVELKIKSPEEK